MKTPRKGSPKWLAYQVATGAALVSARATSASPWKHTLTIPSTDGAPTQMRDVSASQIASLTERGVLHGTAVLEGAFAWNRITYAPGPQCDAYLDELAHA